MKLSIIIVSYNVKDYIKQCIRSIYRSDLNREDYEIIIIDNDSHDGTIQELKNNFDNLKIKENEVNVGFSKAVNDGLNISNGKFICVLNPDVIIRKNTFSSLLNYYEKNDNIGCIGPKILNVDGTIQHSCKRSFPTPMSSFFRLISLDKLFPKSKLFGKYNLTFLDANKIHSVDSISGAFMLFNKKIIQEIGSFDERFFMFGEDIDFCSRIKGKGYKVIYNPNAEIIHYKGESVKNAPYDMVNIFYSAMEIFFNKYSNKYKYWKYIGFLVKSGLFLRKIFSHLKLIISNTISLLFDSLFIAFSFSFSIYLWYTFNYNQLVTLPIITSHWVLIVNFLLSWYFSSKITQIYKQNNLAYTRVFLSMILTFLISSTTTYFFSFFAYSRAVLLISTLISIIFLIFWRFTINILFINKIISISFFKRILERRILIIGANKENIKIGNQIMNMPANNINIIGYVDKNNPLLIDKFLGKIKYIKEIVSKNKITEIIIREDYLNSEKIFNIIKLLKDYGLIFKIIPKENNILLGKGGIEQISGIDLLSYELPFLERSNIFIKRTFDFFGALFIILFLFPIQLFYHFFGKVKEEKIWGIGNEIIFLHYNVSSNKYLRSIRLLYNVLNGNISFVGSKIISIKNSNPNNILKPGLTGLINLQKFKNQNSNTINSYYIRNQSLSFDIEIILKSLFKI